MHTRWVRFEENGKAAYGPTFDLTEPLRGRMRLSISLRRLRCLRTLIPRGLLHLIPVKIPRGRALFVRQSESQDIRPSRPIALVRACVVHSAVVMNRAPARRDRTRNRLAHIGRRVHLQSVHAHVMPDAVMR